jgi:hypothetical protein
MKQATRAIQSALEEKLHSEKKRLVVLLFVRTARPDRIRGFDVFAKGTRLGREEPRRVIQELFDRSWVESNRAIWVVRRRRGWRYFVSVERKRMAVYVYADYGRDFGYR